MDATTERAPAGYLSYVEARSVITGISLAMFLAALSPHKKAGAGEPRTTAHPPIAAVRGGCR